MRILNINRRRIATDGTGVRTLVAFSGCPLHCKYCLNDFCHDSTKYKEMTVDEVLSEINKDRLYYKATNGGITFGGGEPLMHSSDIKELCIKGNLQQFNVTIETSLYVPILSWINLIPYINTWIIDIKDLNNDIYKKYCGTENKTVNVEMIKFNLLELRKQIDERFKLNNVRIIIRVPHIPEYNTDSDIETTKKWLIDNNFTDINEFEYIINV